jgi:hypothetical protein
MMYYVGIDCGLDGAIAVLDSDGHIVRIVLMPTVKKGKGRKIDLSELWYVIYRPTWTGTGIKFTIGVEDPGQHAPSATGLRGMTYSFASVEMAVHIARHRHGIYRALEWQRTFWKKPKMPKGQKFDTKAAALAVAKRLWPEEKFFATPRCKKAHDGIVDALLIAEHTRRQFK